MNRKKILAAVLGAVMLMSVHTVYAEETLTSDTVSDFAKAEMSDTKPASASPAEKRGVHHMAVKLKKFSQLESTVGQAASTLTRSRVRAAAKQEAIAWAAASDYETAIREAAIRSPLYDVPAETAEAAAAAEPVYAEPVYTDYVYTEPVYTDYVYSSPLYAESVYTEPVYTDPAEALPADSEALAAEAVVTAGTDTYDTYDVNTDVYDTYDTYEDVYDTSYDAYEDVYGGSLYTDAAYADPYDTGYTYDDGYGVTDDYAEDIYESTDQRASVSDSDLDLLASIIYCEAGGESYEGQVAVGAVVLNRMESELYPDDMSDVIYQSGQFTPAMTGWLDSVMESGVPDYCYESAQAALNGENPVGDCLYFHAGGGDGLTIGNQTFY